MKMTAILHLEIKSQCQSETSWRWENSNMVAISEEINSLYIFKFAVFLLSMIDAEALQLQY